MNKFRVVEDLSVSALNEPKAFKVQKYYPIGRWEDVIYEHLTEGVARRVYECVVANEGIYKTILPEQS